MQLFAIPPTLSSSRQKQAVPPIRLGARTIPGQFRHDDDRSHDRMRAAHGRRAGKVRRESHCEEFLSLFSHRCRCPQKSQYIPANPLGSAPTFGTSLMGGAGHLKEPDVKSGGELIVPLALRNKQARTPSRRSRSRGEVSNFVFHSFPS